MAFFAAKLSISRLEKAYILSPISMWMPVSLAFL
jgi:hypothetical protein